MSNFYTVTVNNGLESLFTSRQITRLADAAHLKLAWEKNQPSLKGSVVVFDEYGYLVPGSELQKGLRIKFKELVDDLAYFEGLDLAVVAPNQLTLVDA